MKHTLRRCVVCWLLTWIACVLVAPVASARPAKSDEWAARVLGESTPHRGVCAVVGGDPEVALAVARDSELLVHYRDPRADTVERLRELGHDAGLTIQRLAAEKGGLEQLPYATNSVDVVVVIRDEATRLSDVSYEEVERALRPGGSVFVGVGNTVGSSKEALDKWLVKSREQESARSDDGSSIWSVAFKPALEGTDEWSHWEHGPDNNPVSADSVIRAPYLSQFFAGPYYIGMPSVTTAAGGRTFLAIGHIAHHEREWDTLYKLIGRNGYNGTILWERRLPEGYLVHKSAFIAKADTFYMIDGDRALLLDPATGKDKGEIRVEGLQGEWQWMALLGDVLYVLAGKPVRTQVTKGDRSYGGWSWGDLSKGYYGKRIPFGFGDVLAAYDIKNEKRLWIHREETLIDSRGMALDEDKIYLYCPDRHLRALDTKTGEVRWTNGDRDTIGLIEMPGKGLTSTPGFRTQAMTVRTPEALIIQGQTRNNVIAISTRNGYLLWQKKKITNNPNAIYVDGKVILGVGPGGSHVALDPISGAVEEDLGFHKRACTRLTATPDSLFCRGEGTLRYDRASKRLLIDGAARPACNDGALAAGGILYIGPWQCDCNLSLIGHLGKTSAGDFRFDHVATNEERLEQLVSPDGEIAPFEATADDWRTYRGGTHRGGGSSATVPGAVRNAWVQSPGSATVPTPPIVAGGSVFVAGEDGRVRALDLQSGAVRWERGLAGAVKSAPTLWESRLYVGCGDGFVYCLEAASGRVLWRFRCAPVERHILAYGTLSSTWPVHSGVVVEDGVAYAAAGIIDSDGTYLYALDAKTGELIWQNNSSGHLNAELRKGVSVQGNLTLHGNVLLLAGGNQVSPAPFDAKTGKWLGGSFEQGQPKANAGRFVGVLGDEVLIAGGRILYSAPENVATKGAFDVVTAERKLRLVHGGVTPSWSGEHLAFVNYKHGKITCVKMPAAIERSRKGFETEGRRQRDWRSSLADAFADDGAVRWATDLDEEKFEALSLVVCQNAIVATIRHQNKFRAQREWALVGLAIDDGRQLFRQTLGASPLPDGIALSRDGRIVVSLVDGSVHCYTQRG